MKKSGIGVAMVVQNDAETIERSLASFYDQVDFLVISTDPRQGWSGKPITPDDTLDRIRAFDRDGKIEIIEGDYYRHADPLQNETVQREITVDRLKERLPEMRWVVQVDADEVFFDFDAFKTCLMEQPERVLSITWRWIPLFNELDDRRSLVIVNRRGEPHLEQFTVAHRPHLPLERCRTPVLPRRNGKVDPAAKYVAPEDMEYGKAVLHYSYAKSAARVWEKLQTWGHAKEVDAEAFFALWQRARTEWQSIRDFHPIYPTAWPALAPFSREELEELRGRRPSTPGLLRRAARKLLQVCAARR